MSESFKLPYTRSYWVLPGKLMAGYYPGSADPTEAAQKLTALAGCGITHIVNLMEPDEIDHQGQPFVGYQESFQALAAQSGCAATFARFAIPDGDIPETTLMRAILDDIDAAIAAGKVVYVHCWGGQGRTGTVIGCYLARHNIAAGERALQKITELRHHIQPYRASPENEMQRAMVRDWQPGN